MTDELGRLSHAHGERLKELAALHFTAQLLRDASLTVDELLRQIAERLVIAMQFPETTVASISYGAHHVGSVTEARAVLARGFETSDGRSGRVAVGYRTDEPFLEEEHALIASVTDILHAELERRAVQSAANDRSNKLALAMAAADLAIWEWNVDENRVVWTEEMARMLRRKTHTGQLAANSDLMHPDDRERVFAALREALDQPEQIFEQEFRGLTDDGESLWISARGRVVREDGRTRVVAVLADITRRKTLEQSVAQLQKMEAMGRVAAGVAHDFNNLITIMLANAMELADELQGDPRASIVADIAEAARRGAALTKQLLQFSRKSEIQARPVIPDQVIRDSEGILRRLAGPQVQLDLALGCQANVLIDPTHLDQVLMNLVVNARDAMPEGGAIAIATRVEGSNAKLCVSDTGHGMTEATKARIFEPFFTTKAEGQGTGLGLAVVFGVVRQANGTVSVESAPGRGSRFDVSLPIHV